MHCHKALVDVIKHWNKKLSFANLDKKSYRVHRGKNKYKICFFFYPITDVYSIYNIYLYIFFTTFLKFVYIYTISVYCILFL